ncbi:MAG: fumarylacetoacetase [Cyclonatronaceae bacterium]
MTLDKTHAPDLRPFFDIPADSDFPIQNLPFGIFRPALKYRPRVGVAIGQYVLDLAVLASHGFFDGPALRNQDVFEEGYLNAFMDLGPAARREARAYVSRLLSGEDARLQKDAGLQKRALIPMEKTVMELPVEIGDYTDFYSSREHATNVGTMFRGKENALPANWLHVPVGYHGRSSSIIKSGTPVRRPYGQQKPQEDAPPVFGPSQMVDFELEVGFFVSGGNAQGEPLAMEEAGQHIWGLVLVNDWSARDIQKWEYVPLGPFLAKNFATTISPWVITPEALEPFRAKGPAQIPEPFPYLRPHRPEKTYDIQLEVYLQSPKMIRPQRISSSNFRYLYWTMEQQLVHHSISGCNMQTGDLLASGTISGPEPENYGSMLELAWRGTRPLQLADGSLRSFIEDGDAIMLRGYCKGDGYRIGFGPCDGKLLPAAGKVTSS